MPHSNNDSLVEISTRFIANQVAEKEFIPTQSVDEIITMLKKTLADLEENKESVLSFYMVSAVYLPDQGISFTHKSVSQLYMLGGIYHSVLQELKDNDINEEDLKELI
nr:MAG TPA: hypothetical protein [Caudoviricetes sp.]